MAVDRNADGMREWRKEAVKEQQDYFDLLGKPMWREFEPSHYSVLKRQIGFALAGFPNEIPDAHSNDDTGHTDENLKEINKIFGIIQECTKNNTNPNNISVAFLIVVGRTSDACIKIPVIRIQQSDIELYQNINVFIDPCGRVYKNWQDYLDNNKIPECVLCYPKNGVYSEVDGVVEVELGFSPAGRKGAKILQVLDKGGTGLSIGATGIITAGVFLPIAFPVVAGALGVSVVTKGYEAYRNFQTLYDRYQHHQSIGLGSYESRNCWLGVISNVVTIVNLTAAAKSAQADKPMSLAKKNFIKSVALRSCAVNGLIASNAFFNIIVKALNKEKITSLDAFQFTSAVLFFTHTVISTRQAMSLIDSLGKNSSVGSSVDIRVLMKRISEFGGVINAFKSVPAVIFIHLPTVVSIANYKGLPLWSVCSAVGRKLIEITKSMLRDLTKIRNFILEVENLLGQIWESLNEEIDEVVDIICREFGVKHWSELVFRDFKSIESCHIREMASTLIVEKRSLVNCAITAMPSHQRQAISDNGAVVSTDDGPNSVVNGETQTYDEIANILAKFAGRQKFCNPEDFCKIVRLVYNMVKDEFQKKKSKYEETWELVQRFRPDANIEDYKREYGISGNPNNHFLEEVFNEFNSKEQDVLTLLHLAYEKQNAGTSAQEGHGQSFLDSDGVRYYPFYNICGLASNGFLSKEQYREMAAKFTRGVADTYSIDMSDCGDTAVIPVNDEKDVITIRGWLEDGKVSGIAALLRNPSE